MLPQVGAQLYTIRRDLTSPEQIKQAFKRVADAGFKVVQVSGAAPMEREILTQTVAEAAKENGLTIAATHVNFNDLQSAYEEVVAQHRAWNCAYVGVGAMPDAYRTDAQGYRDFAKAAEALAKRLHEDGLTLIYHNHQFEFECFEGKLGIEWLHELTDALQFEIDTYWVQVGGGDVIQWIEKMKGRMDVIHFKDMCITNGNQQTMAAIGEGNLNWSRILQTCKNVGIKWYLIEQDECPRDPYDCLRASRVYLESLGLS